MEAPSLAVVLVEKDGEEDTNNMSYSASFQVEATSDLSDRFMRCKTGVAVRKFDDTLWPSGSWHEIWIAFSLRMNIPFPWTKTTSTIASPGSEQFMIGTCRTDGSVYGQTSASIDTSNQHFIGMYFSDTTPASVTAAEYTGSYAYASLSGVPRAYVTGSYVLGSAGFNAMRIPFTSGSEERTLFAVRFVTHSVTPNLWICNMFHPTGIAAFSNPVTASSQVAQFLSQSSWGSFTPAGYGYTVDSTFHANRSINGYFDGVFVGWQQWFESLHISDIVVRLL